MTKLQKLLTFALLFCFLETAKADTLISNEYILNIKNEQALENLPREFRTSFIVTSRFQLPNKSFLLTLKTVGEQNSFFQNRIRTLKSLEGFISIEHDEVKQIINEETANFLEKKWFEHSELWRYQWAFENTGDNIPFSDGSIKAGALGEDLKLNEVHSDFPLGKTPIIAIIDSGFKKNHPNLQNILWKNQKEINGKLGVDDDQNGFVDDFHGYNFYKNSNDISDGNGHGTRIAGIVGAQLDQGMGVKGLLKDVEIMPLVFMRENGSGKRSWAIKAIYYAVDNGALVINNSWGSKYYSEALVAAIDYAHSKGVLFVTAAGNSSKNNDSLDQFPANYEVPNVISVGSLSFRGGASWFTHFGKNSVDLFAPGQNILTSNRPNQYANLFKVVSGTSYAAGFVTAAAAYLQSREPELTHLEIKKRMLETVTKKEFLRGFAVSSGTLNLYNFLKGDKARSLKPDESLWVTQRLKTPIQSNHPYRSYRKKTYDLHIPGAQFLKIRFKRIDLERGKDFIRLYEGKNRILVESISGKHSHFESVFFRGDHIQLEFVSDHAIEEWGFLIEEVKAIF
ncbi:MAG: S8 family serine peptidase [Bacteriovoracaceae bacterium]